VVAPNQIQTKKQKKPKKNQKKKHKTKKTKNKKQKTKAKSQLSQLVDCLFACLFSVFVLSVILPLVVYLCRARPTPPTQSIHSCSVWLALDAPSSPPPSQL
jgi:lipopolysaccharide/colanic/teichoic acid biosynthesis glycosyltransferase